MNYFDRSPVPVTADRTALARDALATIAKAGVHLARHASDDRNRPPLASTDEYT
jgi:hypothetical protein